LFLVFADSPNPVDQAFQRAKDRVKERPLAFKNTIQEPTKWFGKSHYNYEKHQYLSNTERSHFITSKPFRHQQRIHQINEETSGNNSRDGVLHGILLKTLRRPRETPEQREEYNYDRDIENVQHD
jgi:hypothetical protein